MMKPLRKRHLQVWSLLALLIPLLIALGYSAVPDKGKGQSFSGEKATALPVVLAQRKTNRLDLSIRRSSDGSTWQLQVECPEPLVQASSLLYRLAGSEQELVGRIGAAGTYYFPLRADTTGRYRFLVYDIIHHQVTDSINF